MKKIIIVLAAAAAMFACQKNDTALKEEGTGTLSLKIGLEGEATRATPEEMLSTSSTLEIYAEPADPDAEMGEPLMSFSPAATCPAELSLPAGKYFVALGVGTPGIYATMNPEELYYAGYTDVTVESQKNVQGKITAKVMNIAVEVTLPDGGRARVQAADVYSDTPEATTPELIFEQSGTGYFVLPEAVDKLVWKVEAPGGASRQDEIVAPDPGKKYPVALTYDLQLPNGDMETWHIRNLSTGTATNNAYMPCTYDEMGPFANLGKGPEYKGFWGTGNVAMPGFTKELTKYVEDARPGSTGTKSALLESKRIIIANAAGNIFTGYFDSTVGTSGGNVAMGRPFAFNARPTAVSFWYKYAPGTGNNYLTVDKESGDKARVWMCCGSFPEAHIVTSGAANSATFIDETAATLPNTPDAPIYGYMNWVSGEAQAEWKQVTVPITWNEIDGNPLPTHIIMAATSSYRGDYMEIVVGSKLWIDDIELIY